MREKNHSIDPIQQILHGNESVMVKIYGEYKPAFLKWARHHFNSTDEDALDVFQDAVVSLYRNVKSGKLSKLQYSLKTYLFAVAKNLLLNKLRYEKRFDHSVEDFDQIVVSEEVGWGIEENLLVAVKNLISKLGEPCQTILKLFYYDQYDLESIAREIGSKNSNVAKAQKARCVESLRKMAEELIKNEHGINR